MQTKKEINDPKEQAKQLKEQGNLLFKQNKFQEALIYYDQAYELDKNSVFILTSKAACLIKLGKYYEAVLVCDQARNIDLDWIKIYYREGEAYAGMNDFLAATGSYKDGCRIDPSNTELKQLYSYYQQKLFGVYKTYFTEDEEAFEERIDRQSLQFENHIKKKFQK